MRRFRAGLGAVPRDRSAPRRPEASPCRDARILGQLVGQVPLRGARSRNRAAFARHAQGADASPDRRHRRRAHDLAAGEDRRGQRTGITASAGCAIRPFACCPHGCRLCRGGAGLARLAGASRSRQSRSRPRSSTASAGERLTRNRARLAAGLRKFTSRPHRQRRFLTVAARCLRRGRGCDVPGEAARHALDRRWMGAYGHVDDSSCRRSGAIPTKAYGRCGAVASNSCTRRSWRGSPSTAPSGARRRGARRPYAEWRDIRDAIHAEVCEKGFDRRLGSFVQAYGSKALDASLLRIPVVGFLPAEDKRVRGTVAAIERQLMVDGLVLRYRTEDTKDGLPVGEGAFLPCSFWYADNLCCLAGSTRRGRCSSARRALQ